VSAVQTGAYPATSRPMPRCHISSKAGSPRIELIGGPSTFHGAKRAVKSGVLTVRHIGAELRDRIVADGQGWIATLALPGDCRRDGLARTPASSDATGSG
jgi:hypothetical protein